MNKYFDQQKWAEEFKSNDWYLKIVPDYKKLMEQADSSDMAMKRVIYEAVYTFIKEKLFNNDICLGQTGPNWDAERKSIDTIIIHHSGLPAGMTWQGLSAIHLMRLYATYYSQPTEVEAYIKGQPIYSHHFRDGQPVFYSYHWLVCENGQVERLLNDNEIGWQAGNWDINCRSVAFCLDGNFENSKPPDTILLAMAKIIKERYGHVSKDRIFGHQEINPKTVCPGHLFLGGWKKELLNLL